MDFSGFGDIDLGTIIAAIALIASIVAWLIDRYVLRRKRLVYRVQVDAPMGQAPETDSLTAAFLDYVRSAQARPVPARGRLVPCNDLPGGLCG